QPVTYRIVNGEMQGLDGRNRHRACQELGLECCTKEVALDDGEVRDYILRCNVHRRHLNAELRQEVVSELRSDGQSTRQNAESLGVGQSTVIRDLANSGEPNGSTGAVTGKDGKTYSAKQLPRKPKSAKRSKSGAKDRGRPRPGKELFDWRPFNEEF